MPARSFRLGVATVDFPSIDPNTSVPSLSTLVYTASALTPDVAYILNDVNAPLDTTASYTVMLGLLGVDITNKGYTIGTTSPTAGPLTVTAGQGIVVNVANANWPANFSSAVCAVVFLKKNSGNYFIADYAYIDPSNDFNFMIVSEPLPVANNWALAFLQGASSDDTIGTRLPKGVLYTALAPTTGGVHVERQVSTVELKPDNSANFNVATTRSTEIKFQLLSNDMQDVIRAAAGNWAKFTKSGHQVEVSTMSLATAQAVLSGNLPLRLTLPLNKNGKQEIRLYLGSITQNQTGWTEDWTKDNQVPVSFTFSTSVVDNLLVNAHVEISYRLDS